MAHFMYLYLYSTVRAMYSGVSFVKRRRLCSCFYCRCDSKMRILPVGHGTRPPERRSHGRKRSEEDICGGLTDHHTPDEQGRAVLSQGSAAAAAIRSTMQSTAASVLAGCYPARESRNTQL